MKLIFAVSIAITCLQLQKSYAKPAAGTTAVQYHDTTPGDLSPSILTKKRQVRQAGDCGCIATVFDHQNYQGRSLIIKEQNADFTIDFFNDQVESIFLRGKCMWIFYEHALFLGSAHLLNAGYYSSAPHWGGSGNHISSARALPPSGTTAIALFQHSHFTGRMLVLYDSETDLPFENFNDQVSSIIVTGGSWTLFEHTDFQGVSSTVTKGDYTSLHDSRLSIGGDRVSSVRKN